MVSFKVTAYDTASGEPRKQRVSIRDGRLIVLGKDTQSASLANLVFEFGGKKRGAVRITDPNSGLLVTTDNPMVLDAICHSQAPEQVRDSAAKLRDQMPNGPRQRMVGKIVLGVLAAAGAWMVFNSVNLLAEHAAMAIPPQTEEALCNLAPLKLDRTSKDAQRVERVGRRLVKAMPVPMYRYHFYMDKSKEVNAYCMPGGNIVVLKGMLDKIKSDDELAGVMGHEIGHAVNRDVLKRIAHDGSWEMLSTMVFGKAAQLKKLASSASSLEKMRFSRTEEAAADKTGVKIANAAGYKPDAVADLFERLQDDSLSRHALAFLSDHPATADRIRDIRNEAQLLKDTDK